MASWRGGASSASGLGPPASSSSSKPAGSKKKERWLVTRKTWRYMADAGKLLIPESLRKGRDIKTYTDDDLEKLEEHYQQVCDQQQDFIEWEGPRLDPRVLLASNRNTAPPPPPPNETGPKFRLVLPVGQQPPPGYVQVGKRTLPMGDVDGEYESGPQQESSYVQLPSGLVLQQLPTVYLTERDWYARRSSSPPDSGVLSPEDLSYDDDHEHIRGHACESGIGSGADSVAATKTRNIHIQTDPMPDEFYRLQEEELRRLEEERRREEEERLRKEEEERLAKEQEEKELEAMMGDSVMRYMKMVRRNSKSSDQKKAERFRSMNYDPTLRNIKAKYLNKEENVEGFKKSIEVQVGESLLELLKKCQTPVDPPKLTLSLSGFDRKMSNTASDLSDSVCSPQRRLSVGGDGMAGHHGHHGQQMVGGTRVPAEVLKGVHVVDAASGEASGEIERDFFAHLYSGDMASLETGTGVPEDYYNYLESWYRAQKGLVATASSSAGGTSASGSASVSNLMPAISQPSIYIPVDALQNLRASMPTLVTSAAVTSTNSVSRSTNSLGKSPGQSFLSSVISLRPFAAAASSSTGSGSKIIPKKLWRPRSKSQRRSSVSPTSAWAPKGGGQWSHASNREVILEPTHLLMLHEFERVALQKLAIQKLNSSSDLGVTVRIPKVENSDKTKKRAYLLKKKVLPKWDTKDKPKENVPPTSGAGPVFGVPLGQCVEASRKRSTSAMTGINENIPTTTTGSGDVDLLSPVAKTSRSDSRASFTSISQNLGSMDSLNMMYEFRRQSMGLSSQSSMHEALLMEEADNLGSGGGGSSPCVPTVVMMCIRHLEQFGLRTVGIFRVSSSKKRVRQLREEFDRGGQITLTIDTGVHDVATLLKEFFRDLPEPLIPRDVQPALLATQRLHNVQDQILYLQRIIQLLPLINRDTLYVLMQFLGLVADNAEDKTDSHGTVVPGNKMDTLNLATLFAPNIMHSFLDSDSSGASKATSSTTIISSNERKEHVSALRLLIEKRDLVFDVPSLELNDVYVYLSENFPDVLDALLRRRSALAGIEIPEEFHAEEREDDLEETDELQASTTTKTTTPPPSSTRSTATTYSTAAHGDATKPSTFPLHASSSIVTTGSVSARTEQLTSDDGASSTSTARPMSKSSFKRRDSRRESRGIHDKLGGGTGRMGSLRKHSATAMPSQALVVTTAPKPREAIVYSPASSSFSMASSTRETPTSDMFFASGNTTPSHVTSPPPMMHFGSPPLVYSPPPLSPPSHLHIGLAPGGGNVDKPLVLSPVPKGSPKPQRSATAVSASTMATGFPSAASTASMASSTTTLVSRTPTSPGIATTAASSQASVTSTGGGGSSSAGVVIPTTSSYLSVSGLRLPTKSKTDDLDRYISELEAMEASSKLGPTSSSAGAIPPKTEHKKYTRRRYTDSRHPTTELPDVTNSPPSAASSSPTLESLTSHQKLRRWPQQLTN